MLLYKNGRDFEEAVFGVHTEGEHLTRKFKKRRRTDFSADVIALISARFGGAKHPDTRIGKSLYSLVKRALARSGVGSKGLIFLPAVNTKVDAHHFSDGVFYLPSVHEFPVTIDAFNIDPKALMSLREVWIDAFDGRFYSEADFQSDLFRYKKGTSEWKKANEMAEEEGFFLVEPKDFRQWAHCGRPENHFILTPLHTGTYRRRREFARLVAGYFVKVSRQKTAQQEH